MQEQKEYRNPSIYEKLIQFCDYSIDNNSLFFLLCFRRFEPDEPQIIQLMLQKKREIENAAEKNFESFKDHHPNRRVLINLEAKLHELRKEKEEQTVPTESILPTELTVPTDLTLPTESTLLTESTVFTDNESVIYIPDPEATTAVGDSTVIVILDDTQPSDI